MRKEILFSHFPKLTFHRSQQLLSAFGSYDTAWSVGGAQLKQAGWDEGLVQEFVSWRDTVDEKKIEASLAAEGIRCVLTTDKEYPELLKQIYDPPLALFVRGELTMRSPALAVVGTRAFSPYGKQVTEELVRDLAGAGLTIVSGLAMGIDGMAHGATLDAQGKTVAVLGTGIDRQHVYPAAHKQLAEKIIASGGAVISEYPPGSLPTAYSFPRRNRIIAGMCLGTLVVEAGESSGALITAQSSLDNGREVFAIPQNITSPTSVGVNNLLKMGAKVITSANDILEALNLKTLQTTDQAEPVKADSPTEAKILAQMSRLAVHIDELIKRSELPSHVVNGTMTLMEMKGKVKNLGGMMYVLAR